RSRASNRNSPNSRQTKRQKQIPLHPTPVPSRDSIPDRCTDSRDRQEGEPRKQLLDRTKERKLRRAGLARLLPLACRPRPFWSARSAARWFLEFLYFQPSLASAEPHPSHQTAGRGKRYRDRLSIGYCRPFAESRLGKLPKPERLGPTVVSRQLPPALYLSNSCSGPSIVEAGSPPTDKWTRRVFEPGVDLNKERSARPGNPIHH